MIALTGGTGFIARAIAPDLARTQPVRSIVRAGSETRAASADVASVSDLSDRDGLTRAFQGVGAVIHLAGRAHRLRDDVGDPDAEFRRINVDGTVAVIEAAAAAGVRRVLVASSLKAVGEENATPWDESVVPRPVDPYGRSKLEAERAALATAAKTGVEVVIARFPLVYGPGAPANVLRLLRLVDRGVPLPFGSVRNRRSMIFTGNLAVALEAMLTAPVAGRTFFLSDGHDLSTPELIRAIARALGRPARLIPVPHVGLAALGIIGDVASRVVRVPVTSAEIRRLTGSLAVDIIALRRDTGYQPAFDTAAAWSKTAEWYRSVSR